MSVISLTNIHELTPAEVCNFIEYEYYHDIKQLLQLVHAFTDNFSLENEQGEQAALLSLLFLKLEDETLQMIRNDEQVIFPLIRKKELKKSCNGTKLPVQLIHQVDTRIITLLEKLRHLMNNYLPSANWADNHESNITLLFRLEQQLQQAIYIKEINVLYKVKDKFNQACSGNCKVGKM